MNSDVGNKQTIKAWWQKVWWQKVARDRDVAKTETSHRKIVARIYLQR